MPIERLPLLIRTIDDLHDRVGRWRRNGQRIALVPTMGNLHEGHLALARTVRPLAERVIASIFVNPLQFGAGEDFETYPRTLEADMAGLGSAGADAVFHPPVEQMYPDAGGLRTRVQVPSLETTLCGHTRHGHFTGVATVVTKLLCLVQPDMAIFGRKDYQQLVLIRQLVRDLNLPVQVIAGDTVRESDGLAMSSRNRYLTPAERAIAPCLYRELCALRDALVGGARDFEARCIEVAGVLAEAGFIPDYVAVVDPVTLQPAASDSPSVVIAAAAYLGKARLIDNLTATLSD